MTCEFCELSEKQQMHCAYDFKCAGCCARLIASARGADGSGKKHQEAMLAAIERFPNAPTREAVLDCLKEKF